MDRTDLQRLSKDELIELVLRLQRPDKTSRNSSKPPSTDKKEKRENSRPGGAKPGHEPHNRRLADNPDEFRDHRPTHCELCGGSVSPGAEMELIGEYDDIEIPPVKPYVVRHRRFACRCEHCGAGIKAPAPAVATATPFGPRIHALAIYLKGFQALSYERLRFLFRDAFGLIVSEGALMNMFIRSHAGFKIEADKAKAVLREARVVASDETGVRIEGTNSYHWVFHCKDGGASARLFARRPCRGRDDERPYAERLDFGSLFRAAKAWRRASNLLGASSARHGLCAGAWRGRFAPAVQAVVWQGL
jgi:transposase